MHTESTLLNAEGHAVRPDRVVREGDVFRVLDIKTGARANGNSAAMKGVMSIVTDAEVKELADFIATLQP